MVNKVSLALFIVARVFNVDGASTVAVLGLSYETKYVNFNDVPSLVTINL
ncbi:hypothetical protein [Staphylococcus ratti]|nr:hypothetical protein [Staphylococcus ratti]